MPAELKCHNSIIEVMRFDHKMVEYYVQASTLGGAGAKCQLAPTARGLTAEGVGSGNYSLFRCISRGRFSLWPGVGERLAR